MKGRLTRDLKIHSQACTHKHTHPHTHMHAHKKTLSLTLTHIILHTHTQAHKHTCNANKQTLYLSLYYTLTLFNTHTHKHMHTHTNTRTQANNTHTHTHTHTHHESWDVLIFRVPFRVLRAKFAIKTGEVNFTNPFLIVRMLCFHIPMTIRLLQSIQVQTFHGCIYHDILVGLWFKLLMKLYYYIHRA